MPVIPGPVDDEGNITVPSDGGTVIPIKEQSNAEPPVQISLATTPLTFRVKGRLEKVLPVDPNDALGRILVLDEDDCDQLSSSWHSFQVLDMSDPLLPLPFWSGKIRRAA